MENFLAGVERPAQYIGGEYNSVVKDWQKARLRMAFCFPDTYEIGMSHLGLRILYQAVNQSEDFLCERCFSPREDLRELLIAKEQPLATLESRRPLGDFDVLGFTLQYELSYTNILDMLSLARLPLLASQRKGWPLVIAGGPCAYNPEPLADFIDIFCIGEGEKQLPALLELLARQKEAGADKQELLRLAAQLPGLYVPSLYQAVYDSAGNFLALNPQDGAPPTIVKAMLPALDELPFPLAPLLPHTQVVHDRIMLEIMRGCGRGCRFCQAGIIYRPLREKQPQQLLAQAAQSVANSGYEDIGLISLSSADYSQIEALMRALDAAHSPCGVGVSLPSLRVDAFSVGLAAQAGQVRKSGLTFAPEAGSQRLRDIINKGVTEEDIISAVSAAFSQGYTTLKLYFMIGLPHETMEDIAAIAALCQRIVPLFRRLRPAYVKKPLKISLGVASFVPKAHTPFQWCAQDSAQLLREKQDYLRHLIRPLKQVTLRYHDIETSLLEAAFARGDRRLGEVTLKAWQLGCRADGWSESFKPDRWRQAFAELGLSPEQFAHRVFQPSEPLPWQHIKTGVSSAWLWREYEKAAEGALTADCRAGKCNGCGVCARLGCQVVLAEALPQNKQIDPELPQSPQIAPELPQSPQIGKGGAKYLFRVRLAVEGAPRWLSHLDLLSALSKALRRAALPMAYSEGFNPHMLISWGPAHGVGLAGNSEYLDLNFAAPPPADWLERLNSLLPAGLQLVAAAPLAGEAKALMAAIDRADYQQELLGHFDEEAADQRIAGLLAAKSHLIRRESPKGQKELDIRPALLSLSRTGNMLRFSCRLGQDPAPKAAELAQIIAPEAALGLTTRLAMYIEGAEPLPMEKPN